MRHGSLAQFAPQVASQWHPIKNVPLRPEQVAPRSSMRVWWFCPKGHEWQAAISARTAGGNCPHCHNQMRSTLQRKQFVHRNGALSRTHPELLREWDTHKNAGLSPDDFTAGSHMHVWWKCPFGHSSKSEIRVRARGHRCPECIAQTSRLEMRLLTELRFLVGDAEWRKSVHGKEVDVFLPRHKIAIEVDGQRWHQAKASLDEAKNKALESRGIFVMRLRGHGLKRLRRTDLIFKESEDPKDIIGRFLSALHSARPKVFASSDLGGYLRARSFRNDAEFQALLAQLPSPEASASFSVNCPNLAKEWSDKNRPLAPSMFSRMSSKKVWWVCAKGHEWITSIAHRARGRGCPVCAREKNAARRRATCAKRGSVAQLAPDIAAEWHPTLNGGTGPADVACGSKLKRWWRCREGHEWQQSAQDRIGHGGKHRCPQCKINDNLLMRKHPELMVEFHPTLNIGLELSTLTSGSKKKAWWVCARGHTWLAAVVNRTSNSTGCPNCSRSKRARVDRD